MARRRPSAASSTAARFNPGRLIRKEDQSAVRHDRLRLAASECGAAGGAIPGGCGAAARTNGRAARPRL